MNSNLKHSSNDVSVHYSRSPSYSRSKISPIRHLLTDSSVLQCTVKDGLNLMSFVSDATNISAQWNIEIYEIVTQIGNSKILVAREIIRKYPREIKSMINLSFVISLFRALIPDSVSIV